MDSLSIYPQPIERRSGFDRRRKEMGIFSKYWLKGRRWEARRDEDTRRLHWIDKHSAKTLAAILLIIMFSVMDAIFTLHLVQNGATELNPIMAYYLDCSPLTFFWVKYLLTCGAILIVLLSKNLCLFNTKFQVKFLLIPFLVSFALVVQWELYLLASLR